MPDARKSIIKGKFKGTSARTNLEKMPTRETFILDGDFIRRLLDYRGWSQADLAKITGITEVTISNKLNGEPAERRTVNAFAIALGVPPKVICAHDERREANLVSFTIRAQVETALQSLEMAHAILAKLARDSCMLHDPLPLDKLKDGSLLISTRIPTTFLPHMINIYKSGTWQNKHLPEGLVNIQCLLFPKSSLPIGTPFGTVEQLIYLSSMIEGSDFPLLAIDGLRKGGLRVRLFQQSGAPIETQPILSD